MDATRVSSGIVGLDEILRGGFVHGLSYLVRGGPGTGKTQLGLHFLDEGVRNGERVLFLSLEHGPDVFGTAFSDLPFDLEHIPFVSLVQKLEGPRRGVQPLRSERRGAGLPDESPHCGY